MAVPLPTTTNTTATVTTTALNTAPTSISTSISTSDSGPGVSSPSGLSYSSGPSPTSRNTSPASVSTSALSPYSSPLVDVRVPPARNIEYNPDPHSDPPANMDKTSFQAAGDRYRKLANERPVVNMAQHSQQQQEQLARASGQGLPRGLASSNWRAHTGEDLVVSQSQSPIMYNTFDGALSPTTHNLQLQSTHPQQFPGRRFAQHYNHFQHAAAAAVAPYPNFGAVSEAQLDQSFAYCYDRGNGQYTRLIPADMLPPLQNVAATQQGCGGMVVLPQPRGLTPNGHSSNTEPVALRNPAVTSSTSPSDTIQSRIDNIVAATPPPLPPTAHLNSPTHNSNINNSNSGNNNSGNHNAQLGAHQHQPQRRPKIYCDKWVHEGVCAFTQQGCKYKHEMPADKLTQHQLGLFHGFPQWWKKQQADLARQRDAPLPLSSSSAGDASGAKDSGGGGDGSGWGRERFPLNRAAVGLGSGGGSGSGSAGGGGGGGAGGGMGAGAGAGARRVASGLTGGAAVPDIGRLSLTWRHPGNSGGGGNGGDYTTGCENQALAPPPTIGRSSRGVGSTIRSPMGNPAEQNLTPYQVSYGSPFGPIGPPGRGNTMNMAANMNTTTAAATASPADSAGTRSPFVADTPSDSTSSSSPTEIRTGTTTSMLATSNPYATLDTFDGSNDSGGSSGDQTTNENPTTTAYAETPRLNSSRLS
ncbi:hypothetical protein F4777DRAFT_596379 [Nemania sp. FL0916]|nr:hypothetical protein F4777DRAFT_596379 [Nemania sp. FL0916]